MPETIFSKKIPEFWTPERCFIQEILNDPSHPNNSLAIARVPPGVTTQLHRLHGTEETYIIKRGVGVLEIDCLLYTSPSPRDSRVSRMPSSA